MTSESERRIRTAAQIANYGLHLGLLPYQIDEAVSIGMRLLDNGKSNAQACQAGRRAVDDLTQNQIRLRA